MGAGASAVGGSEAGSDRGSPEISASSLNRLRKALVMRAYNIRKSDETLDELFRPHAYRSPSISGYYISVSSVKKILSENAPWVDLLFQQIIEIDMGDMEFNSFIHFLETGNKPKTMDPTQIILSPKRSLPKMNHTRNMKVRPPTDLPPTKKKGGLPPTPPRKKPPQFSRQSSMSKHLPSFNPATSSIYPGVVEALQLHTLAIGIHSGALVPSAGLTVALDNKSSYRNPNSGPTRPLWRKREVVKQERTVEYTTIDANGVTQELTEKEITTTEVLHMECRETGEFAHRETTNYEQSETFNDELVAEEKGNEEYVHMKSIDDEYEFLDSNMPKKEAPPEPDPGTPYTPGGDGGENYENYPNSPSDRADEKPMHNTAMHELNVSDDDDDGRRYAGGMHSSSPSSTDANDRFRKGASGGSGNQRFDDSSKDENDSPGAGLWQSMGGAGGWVPPPNTDYESELLDNDLTPPSRDERHNINNDAPAGVRRPDLFAPSDDVNRHDSDDNDDMESVSGQANLQGDSGRYNSSDENTSRHNSRHNSRPTSRHGNGSRRSSGECEDVYGNPSLGKTGDTLQSDMFRSDDHVDHTSMFQPDSSRDKNDVYGENENERFGQSKDSQDILFTNMDSTNASAAAKWGSEDDID